jgi:hypothetical protein
MAGAVDLDQQSVSSSGRARWFLGAALVAVLALAVVGVAVFVPSGGDDDEGASIEAVGVDAPSEPVEPAPVPEGCATAAGAFLAPSAARGDALQLFNEHAEAPLPLDGHENPWRTMSGIESAEAYLSANPSIPDPLERTQVMRRNGFHAGLEVDYEAPDGFYRATILRFGSPEGALDYARHHVASLCVDASDLRPVPGLPSAIVYNRVNLGAPTIAKAVFVSGSDEISLALCECVDSDEERLALASEWATRIARQLGAE